MLPSGAKRPSPHAVDAAETCRLELLPEFGWEKENINSHRVIICSFFFVCTRTERPNILKVIIPARQCLIFEPNVLAVIKPLDKLYI